MKTNHIITYLVIAIILISCGKSSSEDNKKGNKDSLEISGTISMIANTVFPTAEAAEQEVSCSSICLNIDQTKCLKLNLIEGNGSLKLLCKTDIKDNGTYSFNIENKGSLKGKALKIEVDNFNGSPRSFFTDVGDIESTEKIKSDINEMTTATSDVEKKYFIDNKNGVATPILSKEEHGQLLRRDLIRMCPNVITESNVLDVIRRYMGVLASSDKASLLIEFRKLSELGSVANIQSQIDSFCSLLTSEPSTEPSKEGNIISNCSDAPAFETYQDNFLDMSVPMRAIVARGLNSPPAYQYLAQSFTATNTFATYSIGFTIFFYFEGATSEIQVRLDQGGLPGELLAISSAFPTRSSTPDCLNQFHKFQFANSVSFVKNQKYWIIRKATNDIAIQYAHTGYSGYEPANTSGERALMSIDGNNWTTPCMHTWEGTYIPDCSLRYGIYK